MCFAFQVSLFPTFWSLNHRPVGVQLRLQCVGIYNNILSCEIKDVGGCRHFDHLKQT